MKTLTKASLIAVAVASLGSAGASFAASTQEVATVISSTPVYQRVETPRRECWTEQVTVYQEERYRRPEYREVYQPPRETSGAGTLLGAIIGGAIGHQFGNTTGGRDRGTAAGAVIGGLIGHQAERDSAEGGYYRTSREVTEVRRVPVTRDVQRCKTVAETTDEISGYDVVYRYQGRDYTTRLAQDPGKTLPIEVNVRPRTSYDDRQPVPTYRRTY